MNASSAALLSMYASVAPLIERHWQEPIAVIANTVRRIHPELSESQVALCIVMHQASKEGTGRHFDFR